jgi:hypothetical protein
MSMNTLALASALSDHDLLARIGVLAVDEREATVELVAHLAALDARPAAYAALGYGSLFAYCTDVLHLSEDATCNRTKAARASRRFPVILDLLASGALSLTSVRLLAPCLTPENHQAVLARASGKSRREIEELVAELAPRPDVPTSVRKLPVPAPTAAVATSSAPVKEPALSSTVPEPPMVIAPPAFVPPARRPVIQITSPDRYRVQFTIGKDGHDKLRRLQDLLRREIPDGDAGAIVERAISVLLEKVEKAKRGAAARPRPIRPGTDDLIRTPLPASRDIPRSVKRGAARRDRDHCAYVAPNGTRCAERTFLEFHHLEPYAKGGLATVDNISLRCRRHNQYEAELIFGARPKARTETQSHSQTAAQPRPTANHPRGDAARGPAVPPGPGTARATPA